mmetsp:Transcript_15251/g.34066  ORF Transcript_15251/g.34066 Transcript_15251/m.34066 type:complete len:225 (+) Transcript_15251:180-854(+)
MWQRWLSEARGLQRRRGSVDPVAGSVTRAGAGGRGGRRIVPEACRRLASKARSEGSCLFCFFFPFLLVFFFGRRGGGLAACICRHPCKARVKVPGWAVPRLMRGRALRAVLPCVPRCPVPCSITTTTTQTTSGSGLVVGGALHKRSSFWLASLLCLPLLALTLSEVSLHGTHHQKASFPSFPPLSPLPWKWFLPGKPCRGDAGSSWKCRRTWRGMVLSWRSSST